MTMKLSDPQLTYYEKVLADLTGGNPDGTHMEWMWAELESLMTGNATEKRDAREDTTILDLCKETAKKAAIRWANANP
jgi:hypothetical protein